MSKEGSYLIKMHINYKLFFILSLIIICGSVIHSECYIHKCCCIFDRSRQKVFAEQSVENFHHLIGSLLFHWLDKEDLGRKIRKMPVLLIKSGSNYQKCMSFLVCMIRSYARQELVNTTSYLWKIPFYILKF